MKKPWLAFYPEGVPYEVTAPSSSVFDLLKDSADLHPNKVAVLEGNNPTTYLELKCMAEGLAASLYENGFRKGDLLAIMLPNCFEYILSFYAVQRLGGTVVQVNPMYQPRELENLLEDSGAKWFISHQAQVQKIEKIGYKEKLHILIADGDRGEDSSLYFWVDNGKNEPPIIGMDVDNDIAILQYTGGTTGKPKGVMISHYNVVCNLYQNKVSSPEEANGNVWERVIGMAPMFHAMGLTIMITTIFRGGTYYPILKFDLNIVVDTIKKIQPTVFSGSPTMYIALLNHPGLKAEDLSAIKSFGSGSAPLSVEVMKAFEEKTSVPITESYGLSEATTMTHKNPSNGVRKPGSIGIPVPSTDCRIVDIETGTKDVLLGEKGELLIKGPQIMKGYWKNKTETEKTLKNGWLYTGDLAVMDQDGYFYIVGRKKDMIIAGGYNIYPLEIEEVLYKLPEVKEVCVYGIPDKYRGETVKAAIVLKENTTITEKEVEEWCNEHLARYKVPRYIEFREELPKTAVGKILRTKLIEIEKDRLVNN